MSTHGPRVVLLLCVLTAFSLSAALGPGAEIPVARAAVLPFSGPQDVRALATDGTDYLVLWYDPSNGREGVYATVVSENGATRPDVPLPLIRGYAGAAAVWTGDSYLVALIRYLQPTLLLRLNRDGTVLSPPTPLNLGGSRQVAGLAWDGRRVLAITHGDSGAGAALLDAEGNVVRYDIALPEGARWVTASAANRTFIVAWPEELVPQNGATPPLTRVRAVSISADGEVGDPVQLVAPVEAYVSVGSARYGSDVGVIARIQDIQGNVSVARFMVDSAFHWDAAAPLALAPFVTGSMNLVATSRGLVVAYLAITAGKRDYELRTIEFGSATVRSIDVPPTSGGWLAASNGSSILAVHGSHPLRATTFNAGLTGVTTGSFTIPTAPAQQSLPVIASAGDHGVIAWVELGFLKLRRIDRHGNLLDAEPLLLGTAASRPAVVFTGQVWLVAWVEPTGTIDPGLVKVRRVSVDGAILGNAVPLDVPDGDLALASNGNVAALVSTSHWRRQGLRLTRFTAAGELLDRTPILLTTERSVDDPAIASNGDGFLAVWSRSNGYTPHIHAKRLDVSGNPMDAAPIEIATGSDWGQSAAKVASRGSEYVVAYAQFPPYVSVDPPLPDPQPVEPTRVFTKRVLATGVLADGTADQDGAYVGIGTFPEIVADGTGYVVTLIRGDENRLVLSGTRLDAPGRPTGPPRLLAHGESYVQEHGVTSIGGVIWATYSRIVADLASVHRVFLREVTEEQQVRRRGARR